MRSAGTSSHGVQSGTTDLRGVVTVNILTQTMKNLARVSQILGSLLHAASIHRERWTQRATTAMTALQGGRTLKAFARFVCKGILGKLPADLCTYLCVSCQLPAEHLQVVIF